MVRQADFHVTESCSARERPGLTETVEQAKELQSRLGFKM